MTAMDAPIQLAAAQKQQVGTRQAALKVLPFTEMQLHTRHRYAIKRLLPRPAFVLVFGASGSGKTFLVGHAALSVGAGQAFMGHKVRRGLVVYVASENPTSVEQRFAAWRDELGIRDADLLLVAGSLDLLSARSRDELLQLLRLIIEKRGDIALVVIDTAAQAMPGADENTSEDMGGFVHACQTIRDEFETCVVAVHHSGKDATKGARGHSVLRAAVDVEIEVSDSDGYRVAKVTKDRDGATGTEIPFSLRQITIGTDEDGDAITTCLVEPSVGLPPKQRKGPTGAHQKIVFKALQRLCSDEGKAPPHLSPYSAVRAVTVDRLRVEVAKDMAHVDAKHRASRVSEAITALKANDFILGHGEWLWLPTSRV